MTFDDIPAGSAIFVDANVFVYYFEPHPVFGPPCQQLFRRMGRPATPLLHSYARR